MDLRQRREGYIVALRREEHALAFRGRRVPGPPPSPADVAAFAALRAQLVAAPDAEAALAALRATRARLAAAPSAAAVPGAALSAAGLLPLLLRFADPRATAGDPRSGELVGEAVWALSNYLAADACELPALLRGGLLPALQRALALEQPALAEHALFCLCNALGEDLRTREELARLGLYALAFEALARHPRRPKLAEVCAWLLSNSLRPPAFALDAELLARAGALLSTRVVAAQRECAWALAFYLDRGAEGAEERAEAVARLRPVPALTALLARRSDELARPALRVLGYLTLARDPVALLAPPLPAELLHYARRGAAALQLDALWALANLLAAGPDAHAALLGAPLLETVLAVCSESARAEARAAAARALLHALHFAAAERLATLQQEFGLAEQLMELLGRGESALDESWLRCLGRLLDGGRAGGSDAAVRAVCAAPALARLRTLAECEGPARVLLREHFSAD